MALRAHFINLCKGLQDLASACFSRYVSGHLLHLSMLQPHWPLFISSVSTLPSLSPSLDKFICQRFLYFNGLFKEPASLIYWSSASLIDWLIHSFSQSTTLRYSTLGLELCTWNCDWPILWLEGEHSTWVSNSVDPDLLPRINPMLKALGQCMLVVKSMASEVRLPAFEWPLCHYCVNLGKFICLVPSHLLYS